MENDFSQLHISTPRLELTPISMDYLEIIFSSFTPEITQYMFPKSPTDISETENFINDMLVKTKKGEDICLVILDKKKQFIGIVGVHEAHTNTPDLGLWLKKSAHGNKYGLEAITALKEWVEKNLEYFYLAYPVDRRNIASKKIPEALGAQVEAEYQKQALSGNILEILEYRIYKNN